MRPGNALSRRSATDSSLRGLARRSVLPSVRRATLMGFTSALRRLAPASGGRSSQIVRAHMPVRRNRSPRLVFVGCFDSFDRDRSGTRLDWLLGLIPFCGPFLTAIVRLAARSFLPWTFASCRVWDTLKCIRTGSTPPGSSNPKGRDASALTDRHVRTLHPLLGFRSLALEATSDPFSVFEGLTPCPSGHFRAWPGKGSLSEVSHRP
jgi:hypothetical protein